MCHYGPIYSKKHPNKGIQATAIQGTTSIQNMPLHPPHLMPQSLDVLKK